MYDEAVDVVSAGADPPTASVDGEARPASTANSSRKDAVDRAREMWIRRLIDMSRRNMLLYYRDLKSGTLDLTSSDPGAMAQLLRGSTVQLSALLPEQDETAVGPRVREIRRRALSNLEEKGLQTLFVVFGLASWAPVDGGRPPEAPILMVPVAVETRGSLGRAFSLRRIGGAQINPVLLHALEAEHGVSVTSEWLLGSDQEKDLTALIEDLGQVAARQPSVGEPAAGQRSDSSKVRDPIHRFREGQPVYDKEYGAALVVTSAKDPGLLWVRFPNGTVSWIEPRDVSPDPPESPPRPVLARYANGLELWVGDGEHPVSTVQERPIRPARASEEGSSNSLAPASAAEDEGPDPVPVFERLTEVAQGVKDFTIKRRAVLGNFSFHKMAMVRDMQQYEEQIAGHDIIAAIADVSEARASVAARHRGFDPEQLDEIHPDKEFLVLDADSTQQKVIARALDGQSLIVQGPPGTGKSQTIANLIATLAAEGKTVLFVAEKRAALDVVLRRLVSAGLRHLALDLHDADTTRLGIVRQLSASREIASKVTPPECDGLHRRFVNVRLRLSKHVQRVHARREPSGLSVYEMQGRLLRTPNEARTHVRWRGQQLMNLTSENAIQVRDLLAEAAGFAALFVGTDPSPWTGARLRDGSAVQQAMDTVARLAREELPALLPSLTAFVAGAGFSFPATLREAQEQAELAAGIRQTLRTYSSTLFAHDLRGYAKALSPASQGTLVHVLAWCFLGRYRRSLREIRLLRQAGPTAAGRIAREIAEAAHQKDRWSVVSTKPISSSVLSGADQVLLRLRAVSGGLSQLEKVLAQRDWAEVPIEESRRRIAALAADTATPHRIPRLLQIEDCVARCGASEIVAELRRSKVDPRLWSGMFEYAWLSSCLDRARADDPELAGFSGRTHDDVVKEFGNLDRARLRVASERVKRAHAERLVRIRNEHREQDALVGGQLAKQTRHLPLRKMLSLAPDVMTALCPCWMASPLSVSQLLGAERRYFDVVVFDEASQVLPEDAVPSILRASQAVVAGDERQLPPTLFFAAGENLEDPVDDEASTTGYESLLTLMRKIPDPDDNMLQWHYRSRNESLIAFSNRLLYRDRLVTFPSPNTSPSITHVLVPQLFEVDGEEESSPAEVARVVQLVIEHAANRPGETLGVVTMGLPHARRIEAALERELDRHPELEGFFSPNHEEPFFVKNLERVQGDERDAIILSVGYGKDPSGRLPHYFGPLLYKGGERRLNVAITRAKRRLTLVSSFGHRDMDPARCKSDGVDLLRRYLEYAQDNGRFLDCKGAPDVPLDHFEADVKETLEASGIRLEANWGVSTHRIDFAAWHPTKPGRFVLAIECDGPGYRSVPTARDRDRLRQQHLESLGWRFHRIWSTDWFMRKPDEVQRALAAYRSAVAAADAEDAGVVKTDPRPTRATEGEERTSYAAPLPPPMRATRPAIPRRAHIEEYPIQDLVQLVQWIESDRCVRTDDEILGEMVQELGFMRKGSRICRAIREAILVARTVRPSSRRGWRRG